MKGFLLTLSFLCTFSANAQNSEIINVIDAGSSFVAYDNETTRLQALETLRLELVYTDWVSKCKKDAIYAFFFEAESILGQQSLGAVYWCESNLDPASLNDLEF